MSGEGNGTVGGEGRSRFRLRCFAGCGTRMLARTLHPLLHHQPLSSYAPPAPPGSHALPLPAAVPLTPCGARSRRCTRAADAHRCRPRSQTGMGDTEAGERTRARSLPAGAHAVIHQHHTSLPPRPEGGERARPAGGQAGGRGHAARGRACPVAACGRSVKRSRSGRRGSGGGGQLKGAEQKKGSWGGGGGIERVGGGWSAFFEGQPRSGGRERLGSGVGGAMVSMRGAGPPRAPLPATALPPLVQAEATSTPLPRSHQPTPQAGVSPSRVRQTTTAAVAEGGRGGGGADAPRGQGRRRWGQVQPPTRRRGWRGAHGVAPGALGGRNRRRRGGGRAGTSPPAWGASCARGGKGGRLDGEGVGA